jgi:hypothetical protein
MQGGKYTKVERLHILREAELHALKGKITSKENLSFFDLQIELNEAKYKLASIRKAMPDRLTEAQFPSNARTFVQKIREIIK